MVAATARARRTRAARGSRRAVELRGEKVALGLADQAIRVRIEVVAVVRVATRLAERGGECRFVASAHAAVVVVVGIAEVAEVVMVAVDADRVRDVKALVECIGNSVAVCVGQRIGLLAARDPARVHSDRRVRTPEGRRVYDEPAPAREIAEAQVAGIVFGDKFDEALRSAPTRHGGAENPTFPMVRNPTFLNCFYIFTTGKYHYVIWGASGPARVAEE